MATDGSYLYYISGSDLRRKAIGGNLDTIANNVTGYYPEGQRLSFNGQFVNITDRVYIGQRIPGANNGTIRIYNNRTNTLGTTRSTPVATAAPISTA